MLLLEERRPSDFREEYEADLWKLLVTPPPNLPNVWDQVAFLMGRGFSDEGDSGTHAPGDSECDGGYAEEADRRSRTEELADSL